MYVIGYIIMYVTYKHFKYRMVIPQPAMCFDIVTHIG
jgi:hypothetical protein